MEGGAASGEVKQVLLAGACSDKHHQRTRGGERGRRHLHVQVNRQQRRDLWGSEREGGGRPQVMDSRREICGQRAEFPGFETSTLVVLIVKMNFSYLFILAYLGKCGQTLALWPVIIISVKICSKCSNNV